MKERLIFWWTGLPSYIRLLIRYGLLVGLINATFLYVMVFTPVGQIPYIIFSRILVVIAEVYFVIKLLKVSRADGKKYFDQVIVGTVVLGVAGIFFGLSVFVLTQYLRPQVLVEQHAAFVKSIDTMDDRTDEEKQQLREQYKDPLTPAQFSLNQLTNMTSNGLVYSLIVAVFVRNKQAKIGEDEKKKEK